MTQTKNSKTIINVVVDPDASDLFSILNQFLVSIGETSLDDDSKKRIKKAIAERKIYFYTAQKDESIIGVCSLTIGFSTYRSSPIGIMEDFFVVPEMRGKGIARLLMGNLLSAAQKEGCGSVIIGCDNDDMPMYEHFGFKTIGNMMAIDIN